MVFLKSLLILFLATHLSFAEDLKPEQFTFKDPGADLISPFTTPAAWIVAAGSVTTGMMYITRKNIKYRKRESFREAQPLGNFGFLGDYIGYGFLNVAYSSYFLWQGKSKNDPQAMRAFEHMLRASSYSFLVTQAIKYSVYEKRPGYPDDHHSFPSGHSSASFAFASVVAAQHGWIWGGLAHGLATFIAVSRSNDDFHYLHDITAGITIGASYAWGVYYNLENGSPYWFTLLPVKAGAGFALGADF